MLFFNMSGIASTFWKQYDFTKKHNQKNMECTTCEGTEEITEDEKVVVCPDCYNKGDDSSNEYEDR